MNEIVNPTCNSLLATFVELNSEVCLKKAPSCLRRLVRPKLTLSELIKRLFPLPLLEAPKRRLLERERKREREREREREGRGESCEGTGWTK